MSADLHIHTEASFDCEKRFEQRLEDAQEHGLDIIALTDHNVLHPRPRKREQSFGDLKVISGIELSCYGDHGQLHILGYFVDPETLRGKVRDVHRPKYLDVIRFIHDAGGVAVLAHPGRYSSDMENIVKDLKDRRLDGLEVEYNYEKSGFDPENQEKAAVLAEKHGLLKTGGSDCHGGRRDNIGSVKISEKRVEKLREASRKYRGKN